MESANLYNSKIKIRSIKRVRTKKTKFRFFRLATGVILSWFQRLFYRPRKPKAPQLSEKQVVHPLMLPILRELKKGGSVTDWTIYHIANSLPLKDTHLCEIYKQQRFAFSTNHILKHLPNPNQCKERFIAIPLTIRSFGLFRHWIFVLIDRRDDTLEFYDSAGYVLEDHRAARLWTPKNGARLNLMAFIEILLDLYGTADTRFLENADLHQSDAVNCALFVLDRMHKRCAQNFTFQEAQKSPLTSNEAFSSSREVFMRYLLNVK